MPFEVTEEIINLFVTDHLDLALNYGWCLNEGRNPKTSDEDWEMFYDNWDASMNMDSATLEQLIQRYVNTFNHLNEEQRIIYWNLQRENCPELNEKIWSYIAEQNVVTN